MKKYWGAPHIPNLGTQGKWPWYTLDRGLGGLQSRSGRNGKRKIFRPELYLHSPSAS